MKELSNEFVIEAVSTKMIKFYHSTRRATFKETIRGKGENSQMAETKFRMQVLLL